MEKHNKKYILAIDQGTTSSRAFLYDENFRVLAMAQHAFPQHFPKSDWVEHDLKEIWNSVLRSIDDALKQVEYLDRRQIVAIGITNQRETFGVWKAQDGEPLHNAIVWQCRRSAKICERLRKTSAGKLIAKESGLVLDPYFSGTKLKWLLDENPTWRKQGAKGEILFGTIDTFLIYKLSGGKSHATDTSNASRTLLMNLKKLDWNPKALKALDVPQKMLPKILSSDANFGVTEGLGILPDGIPICGVLGDQQAALFGQLCLKPGEAKVTYGTGAFLLLNTGNKVAVSKNALSTVAWTLKGKTSYALEGSVFIAGAAVQFLRDNLGFFSKSSEIEDQARSVKDSDGVFFVPALSGLGSPYWIPEAKGLIGGLTRRSSRAHIARACLEGIAASVADVAAELAKASKKKLKSLRVDGGASANRLLLEIQADLLQCKVQKPHDVETTVRGAAYMAALGVGLKKSASELEKESSFESVFEAQQKAAYAAHWMRSWQNRIKKMF